MRKLRRIPYSTIYLTIGEGRGEGDPKLPPPVPFIPSSHLLFLGFLPLALFWLRNIKHFRVNSPIFFRAFSTPSSHPFHPRVPYPIGPLISWAPAPLSFRTKEDTADNNKVIIFT